MSAEEELNRLRSLVAKFVDRDFIWLGNTAQASFRSHSEAVLMLNELRDSTAVIRRADMIDPPKVGGGNG